MPEGKLIKSEFLRKAKTGEVFGGNSIKSCLRRILKVRLFITSYVTNHHCKERINQPLSGPPVLLAIIAEKHNNSMLCKKWTSHSLSNSLLLI